MKGLFPENPSVVNLLRGCEVNWLGKRYVGWLKYQDGVFCRIHMENHLDKQDKDKVKLQNNFLRAGKNLI